MAKSKSSKVNKRIESFQGFIQEASTKFGVPTVVIEEVIRQESGGNATIVSSAGAKGLMQLMPGTAKELGVKSRSDPRQNILGGTKYLAQQFKTFGSWNQALAAYNAGPGNVRKFGKESLGGIPGPKFAKGQTFNYVKNIASKINARLGGSKLPSNIGDADLSNVSDIGLKTPNFKGINSRFNSLAQQFGTDTELDTSPQVKTGAPTTLEGIDSKFSGLAEQFGDIDLGVDAFESLSPDSLLSAPPSEIDPLAADVIPTGPNIDPEGLGGSVTSFLSGATPEVGGIMSLLGLGEQSNDIGGLVDQTTANLDSSAQNALSQIGIDLGLTQPGDVPKAVSPEQILGERQAQTDFEQQATESAPVSSLLGNVAQAAVLPSAATLNTAKGLGNVSLFNRVLKTGGIGAVDAATFEVLNNPDATLEDIITVGSVGGGIGAAIPGFTQLVKGGAGKSAEKIMSNFLSSKDPKLGARVLEEGFDLSASMTKKRFLKQALDKIVQGEAKLQSVLKTSKKTVDINSLVLGQLSKKGTSLNKFLNKKIKIGDKNEVKRVIKSILDANKGNTSVASANEIKRAFWNKAKFSLAGDPKKEIYSELGEIIKDSIEAALPNTPVKAINRSIGTAIGVEKALTKNKQFSNLLDLTKLVGGTGGLAALGQGDLALVFAALGVARKSTAANTVAATTLRDLSKLSELSPEIQKIMNTILPQLTVAEDQ